MEYLNSFETEISEFYCSDIKPNVNLNFKYTKFEANQDGRGRGLFAKIDIPAKTGIKYFSKKTLYKDINDYTYSFTKDSTGDTSIENKDNACFINDGVSFQLIYELKSVKNIQDIKNWCIKYNKETTKLIKEGKINVILPARDGDYNLDICLIPKTIKKRTRLFTSYTENHWINIFGLQEPKTNNNMIQFACFAYQLYIKRRFPSILYFNGIDFIFENFYPGLTIHAHEEMDQKIIDKIYQNLKEKK